jgi:aminopeptidase-like protein
MKQQFSDDKGQQIYALAKQIFPYCRSITGGGVRQTLSDLKEYIGKDNGPELKVYEVPSGTPVFDWTVPKEWLIREAYIEDAEGNHIIDMKEHNLHVVGYSTPVDEWVDLEELKAHIYTQPDEPDVIPYVTSYYKECYGFCMSENQKNRLKPGKYHMYIDSELFDGVLNYAEVVIPGESEKEIFFSTYFCHPSMANNECSGPALSAELVRFVASMKQRKYTYRFIYIPETIGSITYMSQGNHLQHMKDTMIAGFNLSCVGDDRDYSIVESRYGDTLADKVLKNVLHYYTDGKYSTYSFLKRGSDERQYNAPGIELPVVCYCRSKFGEYPEYHTSADNMGLVSPSGFQGSYEVMTRVIQALEYNGYYKMNVLGEPQLGKRGLYPTVSQKGSYDAVETMTDFITYADGKNDLIDISNRIGMPVSELREIAERLMQYDLCTREETHCHG